MTQTCTMSASSSATGGQRRAYACTGASLLTLVSASGALALDLGNEPSLFTETVAGRDRLKYYDRIKIFGAERVADRDHNFEQPHGLRLGNLHFLPSVEDYVTFDDNIYATGTDPIADLRNDLMPVIRMHSKLPRHALSLIAGAKSVSYLENTDQNYNNIFGQFGAGLDIDHAHTLSVSFGSAIEHEERREITAPLAAAEPGQFYRNTAAIGITRDVGRLYGTLSAAATWLDYEAVLGNDGTMLDQDARDQRILSTQLRAGYRISPGFEAIGKLELIRRDNEGIEEDDRDSTGYEATAGLNMESSPLLRWQFIGGYGIREFDRTEIETVRSFLLEARVEWLPTQRMTVYGSASHKIDDSLGADDAGRIETAIKGSVDYEIYHNLVGHAGLALRESELIGSDRTDTIYEASLGLDYHLSGHWLLSLDYRFQERDSTTDDFDMSHNQIRLGARYRY